MSEDEARSDDEAPAEETPEAADESTADDKPKAADKPRKEFAIVGQGSLFDGIAYWVTVIGIYLMVGGLMFYSGKEKLFDDNGNAPSAIQQQFQGSFLAKVPGVDAAWTILGILEFGVALLLIVSLLRVEFLPHRAKVFMQLALAVALLTFACLAFGQTATKQFQGVASLYQYFGATVVIMLLVRLLPPHRPDNWLGGSAKNGD
jgi:peptidoglycan/LPS O-acetylase OafA/YrhL